MAIRRWRPARGGRPTGLSQINSDLAQQLGVVDFWPLTPSDPRNLVSGRPRWATSGTVTNGGSAYAGIVPDFAGTDGLMQIANYWFAAAAAVTLAFRIRLRSDGAGGFARVFHTEDAIGGFGVFATGGQLLIRDQLLVLDQSITLPDTTSVHDVVWTWASGGDRIVYVNGALSHSIAAGTGTLSVSGGTQEIGNRQSGDRGFDGQITDFVLSNRVWPESRIAAYSNPATRWDLYWVPSGRRYVFLGAAAGPAVGAKIIFRNRDYV